MLSYCALHLNECSWSKRIGWHNWILQHRAGREQTKKTTSPTDLDQNRHYYCIPHTCTHTHTNTHKHTHKQIHTYTESYAEQLTHIQKIKKRAHDKNTLDTNKTQRPPLHNQNILFLKPVVQRLFGNQTVNPGIAASCTNGTDTHTQISIKYTHTNRKYTQTNKRDVNKNSIKLYYKLLNSFIPKPLHSTILKTTAIIHNEITAIL